uniref:MFS domain-containing protein n=1 Tax=Caenorhabditis japonica TaxID=281687 RepID=A0A8R1DEK3_CAEJA
MSPSYMAPTNQCTGDNCTFVTVQAEFNITKTLIDPGEMTSSVFFLGNGVLGQIYAVAADRIGRRPVLIASLFISGLSGILAAYAPTFETMLIGRFFQGSCFTVGPIINHSLITQSIIPQALTMINWVMCCESTSLSGHGYASVLFGLCWVIGYCSVSPLAIYFSTWRYVQLATSVPCVLFGILMLFTLPESFSFLVAKRKRDELAKWIQMASRVGNEEIDCDADQIVDMSSREADNQTLWQTLKLVIQSKLMITYTAVESFLWIVDLMIYSALSLSSTGIGSMHFSYIVSGLVEIPSYFLIPAAIDWLGRKPSVMVCHMILAFSLLSMYLFDHEADPEIFLIIWLIAKFAVASAFMLCFVYGAELFPTNCRSICLGTCATISNIGAVMAPHVPAMDIFFPGLHYLFYALCSFICTILTTILPETKEFHNASRSQPQSLA